MILDYRVHEIRDAMISQTLVFVEIDDPTDVENLDSKFSKKILTNPNLE